MIASSLDGGQGCHNIQVSGADTCAQQCRMPLRNPVSNGRFGSCSNFCSLISHDKSQATIDQEATIDLNQQHQDL